jgi:hypothetical protein
MECIFKIIIRVTFSSKTLKETHVLNLIWKISKKRSVMYFSALMIKKIKSLYFLRKKISLKYNSRI